MLRELLNSWAMLGFPVEELMAVEPSAMRGFLARPLSRRTSLRGDMGAGGEVEWDDCGFARVGNVGLVRIEGPIARCGGWWYAGYDQILEAHDKAFRSDVRGVLQVHHSPGGVVSGGDEAAMALEKMAAASGKPLHAIASDAMYSMSIRLAFPASKRWITRAGGMGSIGIVTSRDDWTKANEMSGIRVETVASGDYKTDGNPDVPVTKEELGRIHDRVMFHYGLFADAAVRATGLTLEQIAAQKAGVYLGARAVEAKLADGVSTLQEAIARLEQQTSSGRAMVAVPAGPKGQQSAKGYSMEMGMLVTLLGLAADAKDHEITARVQTLTVLENKVRETTGKADASTALATIEGWRASAAKLTEAQAELAKVQEREEKSAYQALVAKGEESAQITPGNRVGVLAKFPTSAQLAAYLEVAPRALPGQSTAAEKPAGKVSEERSAGLTYKGKAYKDLSYSERAAWKGEDAEAWAQAKAEYDRQKGG